MSNNYFLNAYKKNSPKPEDMEVPKEKTVKPFVFEKVPTTPPQDKLEEKIEKKATENEEPVSKVKLSAIFFVLSGIDKASSILKSFNLKNLCLPEASISFPVSIKNVVSIFLFTIPLSQKLSLFLISINKSLLNIFVGL